MMTGLNHCDRPAQGSKMLQSAPTLTRCCRSSCCIARTQRPCSVACPSGTSLASSARRPTPIAGLSGTPLPSSDRPALARQNAGLPRASDGRPSEEKLPQATTACGGGNPPDNQLNPEEDDTRLNLDGPFFSLPPPAPPEYTPPPASIVSTRLLPTAETANVTLKLSWRKSGGQSHVENVREAPAQPHFTLTSAASPASFVPPLTPHKKVKKVCLYQTKHSLTRHRPLRWSAWCSGRCVKIR
jgi:hypothetical protein